MKLEIKKLVPDTKLPTRGSDYAAGYDLYACRSEKEVEKDGKKCVVIPAHSTVPIGRGVAVAIPEGYFGGIYARSGLSIKQGLRPGNCTGVIDSDYRGELIVGLHNDKDEDKTVEIGERIAQLIVQPFVALEFEEKEKLSETVRGEGGFGSTGTN